MNNVYVDGVYIGKANNFQAGHTVYTNQGPVASGGEV